MSLGIFESDAQAKTLGCDVILYVVKKQRIDHVIGERGGGATLV